MSARRQARTVRKSNAGPELSWIPVQFRIGMCIEVWAPHECRQPDTKSDYPSLPLSARRNYRDARDRWLLTARLSDAEKEQVTMPGRARLWSYEFLKKNNPGRLAQRLTDFGLPADWKPQDVRLQK